MLGIPSDEPEAPLSDEEADRAVAGMWGEVRHLYHEATGEDLPTFTPPTELVPALRRLARVKAVDETTVPSRTRAGFWIEDWYAVQSKWSWRRLMLSYTGYSSSLTPTVCHHI